MSKIAVSIMTYEKVIELSSGKVTIPKTMDMSLQNPRPFRSGLLCEEIFGTLQLECHCGKYKGRKYIDMTCPNCGIQITKRSELYKRLGHIKLTLPVIHPLATKGLAKLFNLSKKIVKDLIDCKLYIKYFPEKSSGLISRRGINIGFKVIKKFKVIENNNVTLLSEFIFKVVDWENTYKTNEYLHSISINPLDYVLKAILVAPSGIRLPLKRADGKYIDSGLNVLYKKILLRCNRIRKILPHKPPMAIKLLEWKLLQRAVNNLYVYGTLDIRGNKLKSLLEMIKGKNGLPRNNLLGKRLDFSGRSVIVGNPQLPIDTISIPIKMAVELYKPFIFNKLKEMKIVSTIKEARIIVKNDKNVVKKVLLEVIKDKVVMLNRQPTLHRYGIQGFKVKVHTGHAIQIPPIVMSPFNADCDGDQMAIYIPLSSKAVNEVKNKITVEHNLISSVNGGSLLTPSHEMLIGAYYATNINETDTFKDTISSYGHLDYLLQTNNLSINTAISYKNTSKITCPGRVILGKMLGCEIDFIITKKNIKKLIEKYYYKNGPEKTKTMLYSFSNVTLEYATESGLSVAMKDFLIPSNRDKYFHDAAIYCNNLDEITNEKRIRKWYETILRLQKEMVDELGKDNPVIIMLQSGARAKMSQVSQLNVAKGLISNYKGEVILPPILHSLSEGLNQFEFLQTVYGSRKSMADKKFITPKSGYLARRLISASRDLYTQEDDCGTKSGVLLPKKLATGRFDIDGNLISDSSKIKEDYIQVRSPVKCISSTGICKKCYGLNPVTKKLIDKNIAIGVIAGESITEITSQGSLRAFHTSGAVSISSSPLSIHSSISGKVVIHNVSNSSFKRIVVSNEKDTRTYVVNTKHSNILISSKDSIQVNDVIATYHQDIGQEDVSSMINVLEIYFETKKKGYTKSIVSTIPGTVNIKVKNNEIYIYVDGKLQGKTVDLPIYFGIGDYVKVGQFLTYGEACLSSIYERSKFNLDLIAKIFIERLIDLFKNDGIDILPVHIEVIFRAMTEIVEDSDGKINLRRLSRDIAKIYLCGITKVSRKYPSWLKRLCFGWVKDCIEDVISSPQESLDLPSERILYGGLLVDSKE